MDKATQNGQPLIQVSDFEGPLDLLLHLIKTNEMDIYDIRISTITSQYLTYLHQMQTLRLDIAGEYFVMAANLMAIKAKLLLPKPQTVDPVDEDDPGDPREELVNQLLEYQRYKQAAQELKQRAADRQQHFTRPAMAVPDTVALTVAPGIRPADLQSALQRLVHRAMVAKPVTQSIHQEHFTIKNQMQTVLQRLQQAAGPIDFDGLLAKQPVMEEIVTTFLAVLELARQRQVRLQQAGRLAPLQVNFLKMEGSYTPDVTSSTD
ncbi:segregation and condensation protein A [Levilactobacillus yiduensis]|uniref:segregation and condensation protein A n=1 Tax=Levilactobacillus yiduensis TaxID=2953880 RepID=UPI000EF2CD48|nr:segregation/condensation protein A [Levilactobacillus yiduensis]AYM03222.1 segregation/condensation protein A [Levilactobacillus brevis]